MMIDFTDAEESQQWMAINDHVMGGISQTVLNYHRQLLPYLAYIYCCKITMVLPQYAGVSIITPLVVVAAP